MKSSAELKPNSVRHLKKVRFLKNLNNLRSVSVLSDIEKRLNKPILGDLGGLKLNKILKMCVELNSTSEKVRVHKTSLNGLARLDRTDIAGPCQNENTPEQW